MWMMGLCCGGLFHRRESQAHIISPPLTIRITEDSAQRINNLGHKPWSITGSQSRDVWLSECLKPTAYISRQQGWTGDEVDGLYREAA
jgi:hypothetical protein